MEATGHYWLSLYCFLDQKDYKIHVINPIQTDSRRKGTEIRKRKTHSIGAVARKLVNVIHAILKNNFLDTKHWDVAIYFISHCVWE